MVAFSASLTINYFMRIMLLLFPNSSMLSIVHLLDSVQYKGVINKFSLSTNALRLIVFSELTQDTSVLNLY